MSFERKKGNWQTYCLKNGQGRISIMQSAVYSAVFGSTTQSKRLNLIANNLANVNTTGYKRIAMSFCDAFKNQEIGTDPMISQTRINTLNVDLSQGRLTQTGNPLDLAIEGKGFFKIDTDQGIRYTRAGVFRLTSDGTVTDAHGNELLGDGGPIRVPRGARLVVNNGGELFADDVPLGRIDVVTFEEPERLEQVGQHYFQNPEDDDPFEEQPAEGAMVHQGFLEHSNVEVVQEMVRMIEVSRNVESEQKIMTTSSSMDEKVINNVGKV
jgi:flagellar basal-body rod protein FlgG